MPEDALAFFLIIVVCPITALAQDIEAMQMMLEFKQDWETTTQVGCHFRETRVQTEFLSKLLRNDVVVIWMYWS